MKRFNSALALALSVALSSCGAVADMSIRADRSASLSLAIEIPASVDAKIRQFAASGGAATSSAAAAGPLFDPAAVASSIKARGVAVAESVAPGPRSFRGSFSVKDLEKLLADDGQLADAVAYERGAGWASLELRIDRGNAVAISRLFPGIDADVLEALQPPAIYDNPVSVLEYRSMLAGLLGKSAIGAVDVLAFKLSVAVPGSILESSGLALVEAGRSIASLSVPVLDALVLERPIRFFVKWKE